MMSGTDKICQWGCILDRLPRYLQACNILNSDLDVIVDQLCSSDLASYN